MSKEATRSTHLNPDDRDALAATVLSMSLARRTKAKASALAAKSHLPANSTEEADDLWDNVPV